MAVSLITFLSAERRAAIGKPYEPDAAAARRSSSPSLAPIGTKKRSRRRGRRRFVDDDDDYLPRGELVGDRLVLVPRPVDA